MLLCEQRSISLLLRGSKSVTVVTVVDCIHFRVFVPCNNRQLACGVPGELVIGAVAIVHQPKNQICLRPFAVLYG